MSNSTTTEQPLDQIVNLTEKALAKFSALIKEHPSETAGIRIGVIGGGCAGLQYQMDPCEAPEESDITQHIQDIPFYLNPMVVPYIKGLTVDFSDALVDGGFKFINPNASSTCGCGTSFGV